MDLGAELPPSISLAANRLEGGREALDLYALMTSYLMSLFETSARCAQVLHWEKGVLEDSYRTAELRNLLAQKLRVDVVTISKLLDKVELRERALEAVQLLKAVECSYPLPSLTTILPYAVALITIFASSCWVLSSKKLQKWIVSLPIVSDVTKVKFKVLSRGLRRGRYYAAFLAGLALALSLVVRYIHFSVVLSFFLPASWSARRYLLLGPSLPVTTNALRRAVGSTEAAGESFGINFGPVVILFILNRAISMIDDKIALEMM